MARRGLLRGGLWLAAGRALVGVVVGFVSLFWPGATLTTLLLVFGVFIALDGMLSVAQALGDSRSERPEGSGDDRSGRSGGRWVLALVRGVAGIIVGILAFALPGVALTALIIVIGFWGIVSGIAEITLALRAGNRIPVPWLPFAAGVASMLLGFFFAFFPSSGALVIAFLIGIFCLFYGGTSIVQLVVAGVSALRARSRP